MTWTELFVYEPQSGRLLWRASRPGRGCIAGREAGTITNGRRYRSVMVDGKRHYSHRVAWEIVHGPIPAGMCIDHINGDGLDNRLNNLRVTTLSGNQRNKRLAKNSRTGVPGVFHAARDGYAVTCANEYVGYSKDFATAVAMRKAAEAEHGYHPNTGRKANASHP